MRNLTVIFWSVWKEMCAIVIFYLLVHNDVVCLFCDGERIELSSEILFMKICVKLFYLKQFDDSDRGNAPSDECNVVCDGNS